METNPANPSAVATVCGIRPRYALAGPPLRFANYQKLLPLEFANGGPRSSSHSTGESHPPHAIAGHPLVSPFHPKCSTLSGAVVCNSPCLTLFDSPQTPLTAAIVSAIAISRVHDHPSFVPSQMWMAQGDHHSGDPASGCRLCLIACNSRQFDETWGRA